MAKSSNDNRPSGRSANEPDDLVEAARRALAAKNSAPKPEPLETRTAGEDMTPIPNDKVAPEGASGAEGEPPVSGRPHGG